jgi:1,4-dihydroxy-2-naphthoate octaprenyltransferase
VILIIGGIGSVIAAWLYTGGKRPYGYAGLGEVFVFVFFGLVATMGTTLVLAPRVCVDCSVEAGCPGCISDFPWLPALLASVVMGCLATAILVANNLRDRERDRESGKMTLAVRLSDRGTRILYLGLIIVAAGTLVVLAGITSVWALSGLVGLTVAIYPVVRVLQGVKGRELIDQLKWTGLAELATALTLGLGLGLGWFYG